MYPVPWSHLFSILPRSRPILPPFHPPPSSIQPNSPTKPSTKSSLCCSYTHRSMAKLPGTSPLKKAECPDIPHPPEAISCEELCFSIFISILRALFNSFPSGLFLLGRVLQKPSVSLILGYESAIIDTTAKEASLSIATGCDVWSGVRLRLSCLCSKHVANWAISLDFYIWSVFLINL